MTHAYPTGYTHTDPRNHTNVTATDIMALFVGATLLFVLLTFGFAWQPWADSTVTLGKAGSGSPQPQDHHVNVPLETEWQVPPTVPFVTGPCGCGSQDMESANPID